MRREDNDSWDLLTGVGTTATGIAAARALASEALIRSSQIHSRVHWSKCSVSTTT